MPCVASCLRASTLAQIGPPHPSDSIMGGPRSADPEEKREPCERHPNTPIDGRKSEVLDIERPNREVLNNRRQENENSADRRSDVPAGTMDEASPLYGLCDLMSESKHAGPDWSATSSGFHHGRAESADPEEKHEPCERHP